MILLDTTVLLYAIGAEHHLRAPSAAIADAVTAGLLDARITVEVLQEFTHVRGRRYGRDDAREASRRYATVFDELLMTHPSELLLGLDLFVTHPGLGAFDAVLAAVALERRAEALVSADHAFSDVPGLQHLDPAAAADLLLG